MARLIEFFTVGGELVLDPFAGVGGTLLGAAICRTPRRALGFELEPRWAQVYDEVVRAALDERGGLGPELADLGPSDPGGPRRFDPSGCRLEVGDAVGLLAALPETSVDFVATDPPYNPQLKLTMAGGPLAETHANRRTDYAMVTDSPADLANSSTYEEYLERMGAVFAASCGPGDTPRSSSATPTRTAATALPGRTWPRVPRPWASCRRATWSGIRPARGCARTAIRTVSCPTSCTSTSSSCAPADGDGRAPGSG